MTNSNLLKGRIVSAGYTQRTLAKALGMSENTLGSRISNHSEFNLGEADTICKLLGITDPAEKCQIFFS